MKTTALLLTCFLVASAAAATERPDGRLLMEESLRRHAPAKHLYEEQTLVLTDAQGRHTVRTLRHYAVRDERGSRDLRVIDTPVEARGAAILVLRDAGGRARHGAVADARVFGSNFLVADLEDEWPADFRYEHDGDIDLERVPHHVLRVLPAAADARAGQGERRIYLRKDNLFVSRIEYRDGDGRTIRRQTFRAPRPEDDAAWRAGMILMEDLREGGRSLLKVERRVLSADYVPESVFARKEGRP